ncbi:MAG: ribonuclease HII [Candidatus Firestonebacteria bacterium]
MRQSEQDRLKLLLKIENSLFESGIRVLAGVDEVGRGPLAGPVIAAAVAFSPDKLTDLSIFSGINDSKKVKPTLREKLSEIIMSRADSYAFGSLDEKEIDRINILRASLKAMKMAAVSLKTPPDMLLIDGPYEIRSGLPQKAIIGGDSKSFVIAAASIIAKVKRDAIMVEYDKEFPRYGFARHKGYGTKEHIAAIRKYGRCRIHRQCFGKDF